MEKLLFSGIVCAEPKPRLDEERELFCELRVRSQGHVRMLHVTSATQYALYSHAQKGDSVLVTGVLRNGIIRDAAVFRTRAS